MLGGPALHDDEDQRAVTVLTDDERPFVIYADKRARDEQGATAPEKLSKMNGFDIMSLAVIARVIHAVSHPGLRR